MAYGRKESLVKSRGKLSPSRHFYKTSPYGACCRII